MVFISKLTACSIAASETQQGDHGQVCGEAVRTASTATTDKKTRARTAHVSRNEHKRWLCQGPEVCMRTPGAKSLEHKPGRRSPRNRMFHCISNYPGLWAEHPLLTRCPPLGAQLWEEQQDILWKEQQDHPPNHDSTYWKFCLFRLILRAVFLEGEVIWTTSPALDSAFSTFHYLNKLLGLVAYIVPILWPYPAGFQVLLT